MSWESANAFGAYEQSATSASINNLWYSSNPNKRRDALITPAYDFSGIQSPELSFDVSYARYSAARFDSLNVYYSTNCGSKWERLWSQTGTELATAPDQTVLFKTSANWWKTVKIPLLDLKEQKKVSFKFENVTGWGNVLYLDNVNLGNNASLDIRELKRVDVQIFPNPASGMAAVRLPLDHTFRRVALVNMLGETVYQSVITDSAILLPLENLPAGLYLVHLSGADYSQTERLLVGK
ncbi:MAG: T9SS type A sorting domain-containing protein [Bacteroidetes bacterium]|nr:T9SS type A sorting domain-containing protein [Bacteroidota bacterium]